MAGTQPSETSSLLKGTATQDSVQPPPGSASLSQNTKDTKLSYGTIEDSKASSNGENSGSSTTLATPDPGSDVEQQDNGNDDQTKPHAGMSEVRKRLHVIFPAMAVGVLFSAADQTIIVSSYGKIGTDLNALNSTSWIATSYFLTLTACQPLYGKLSDIFSRKSCLLFAYAVFGLGCVFCGLAPNMPSLIAARAFAGIGGGGMTTVCSIILSDIIPLRERGTWQGYMNIIYATGAGIGAPLGGLLSDSIGWRWAFLAQGPACAIVRSTLIPLISSQLTNMD